MEPTSRRIFFKQAGTVAAFAGAAAVMPGSIASAFASTSPQTQSAASQTELATADHLPDVVNLIAHVKDASTGEISIFVGTRDVVIHDRTVAARLVRATR